MIDSPNWTEFEKQHTALISGTPIVWSQNVPNMWSYRYPLHPAWFLRGGSYGRLSTCPSLWVFMSNHRIPRSLRNPLDRLAGSVEPSPVPGHVVRSLCQQWTHEVGDFRLKPQNLRFSAKPRWVCEDLGLQMKHTAYPNYQVMGRRGSRTFYVSQP